MGCRSACPPESFLSRGTCHRRLASLYGWHLLPYCILLSSFVTLNAGCQDYSEFSAEWSLVGSQTSKYVRHLRRRLKNERANTPIRLDLMAKKNKQTNTTGNASPKHPLVEVFGFPVVNQSTDAIQHRKERLCPFHNKVPKCTKDKAKDPLGTCSIRSGSEVVITCPIRFRQNWMIAADAAAFFFPRMRTGTSSRKFA